MMTSARLLPFVLVALLATTSLFAQTAGPQAPTGAPTQTDLAKQLSNPVASLVSVPLQFNWDAPVGPDDDTRFVMNFQPVVPFSLNDDWNLIPRWIMPFLSQPPLASGQAAAFAVSDIVSSAFFSPARPGRFVWGVGPVFSLPATANPVLGSEKWSIGVASAGSWRRQTAARPGVSARSRRCCCRCNARRHGEA